MYQEHACLTPKNSIYWYNEGCDVFPLIEERKEISLSFYFSCVSRTLLSGREIYVLIFLNTLLALANMTPQPTSSLCFYQREFITWITPSISPPQTWSQMVHYIRVSYPLLTSLQNTLTQNMQNNFTNAYWSDTRSFVQARKTGRGGRVLRKVWQKQTILGFLYRIYIYIYIYLNPSRIFAPRLKILLLINTYFIVSIFKYHTR